MEGKDNRLQQNRKVMKQMKRKRGGGAGGGHNTTSSSSPPVRGGIADVADSSDDRFVHGTRGRWAGGGGGIPKQQERHYDLNELDLLDEIDDAQQAQMRAGDFTMMSQMPTAVGGHFKFSSEKNWDAAADTDGAELLLSTEAGQYFTLNLKLLNAGLLTIPFHKRMDYPTSLFTNDELAAMEKAAENAEKNFQNVMQGGDKSGSVKSGSAKSQRTVAIENDNASVSKIADGTEKINLNEQPADPTTTTSANNNDIQEWLDNVLDEGN